ncbi:sodium/potassium-transporting ATPase subunit beta-1b [Electrophorus electricus]|uniref:Sodium/potassium-transporting ATPase subunit beta n=1 Tax=Electrophorus electricus TaxID=8005 RepID=A0A4W4FIU4_ELEEL|nr:sodium/potassium-transporting ATPase subunit beta-1b [Electrophorus electricus]
MPAQNKDQGGWKKFLWNSETGECLGRTGSSWAKIILFFIAFYGFLAGIFIGTIQALLLTLSRYKPTWQDRISPPGLTHHPHLDKAELMFSMNDVDTYISYTKSMKDFLGSYSEEIQRDPFKFEDCGEQADVYKNRGDLEMEIGIRKACRFSRSWLGSCSGIDDKHFGFSEGKPCLIVKLNRIVNFIPKPLQSNDSVPDEAQNKIQPNVIPIYCTNKKEEDAGKLGEVKYYGFGGGFPLQYYPYYGKLLHPHYLQPLVAVQFVNLTINYEIRVECKVFGENIAYSEKDRFQGRFEVKIKVNNF